MQRGIFFELLNIQQLMLHLGMSRCKVLDVVVLLSKPFITLVLSEVSNRQWLESIAISAVAGAL